MEDKTIVSLLQNELPVGENKVNSFADLRANWAIYFNNLIHDDFPKLLRLFYRIDVSEDKLRWLLKEHPAENAGNMITSLVIDRLLQKIKSRDEFRSKPDKYSNDQDEEKW